jgi:proline iminopeptidase
VIARPTVLELLASGPITLSSGGSSAQQLVVDTQIEAEFPGQVVSVNGARLWYRTEGEGEPLLLVPGGPGIPHEVFVPMFSSLADTVTLVYFDPLGRGKSERATSSREYTLARDVDDLEGLRLTLQLGSINLLGHSYGGIVAQAYALKYPDSVRRLILSSTAYSAEMWQDGNNANSNAEIRNQFPEIWDRLQAIRRDGRLSSDAEYQEILGEIPASLLFLYNPSNAGRPTANALSFNPDVYFRIAGPDADVVLGGDLATFDFRSELRTIKAPILITAGRFDRVSIPRYSVRYREYAPQAQFVMFERAGHSPAREEPEAFFRVLREFLRT